MKIFVALALLTGLVIGLAASEWVSSNSNQNKETIAVEKSASYAGAQPRLSHGDHFSIVR